MTVDFWDVGQGDCTVITRPDGKLIVIDVGPRSSPLIGWLDSHPQKQISDVILTHNDADHIGAIPALLESCAGRIERVRLLQDGSRSGARQKSVVNLLSPLKKAHMAGWLKVTLMCSGQTIWEDDELGVSLEVLYPSALDSVLNHATPNEGSAILALKHQKAGIIMWPGDNTVKRVAEVKPSNNVAILFGPHHGAPEDRKRSTKAEWNKSISTVQPRQVQISVGKNTYSHPNPRYLTHLRNAGCEVVCTGLTRWCDRRITERQQGQHVVNGAALLGLRRTSSGFACRGARRFYVTSEDFVEDEFANEHREAVKKLGRPFCMHRATWSR